MSEISILEEATETKDGRCLIDLWYPRIEGNTHTIEIGLIDVRASDGLQIKFDFDRNGWVVLQPRTVWTPRDDGYEEEEEEWAEVGFFPSYARNDEIEEG